MKGRKSIKAPDGGWGWMVCLGSSLITFSLRALDPSFGLVFHDFLMDLDTGSTKTSFITSIYDANMNFSGLLVGPLLNKFSYQKVAFAGAMLSSIGLILTSRAQSVMHIIWTYSVLSSIGTGLATAAAFVALNNYFDKKRGQAVGLSMVGTAVAMMLMPQLAHTLLEAYGFRGTMLIIGGWAMHSLIGSCLLRPLEAPKKREEQLALKVPKASTRPGVFLESPVTTNGPTVPNTDDNETEKSPSEESEGLLKKVNEDKDRRMDAKIESGKSYFSGETRVDDRKRKFGWWRAAVNSISNFLDLELLKNPVYLNVIIGLSLYNVAEVNFKLMTPFFLDSVGMTKKEIAFCLSLTAFTDIVARLILPVIYDRMGTSRRRIFWMCSMLVGVFRSVLAERTKGSALIVILVIMGFVRGAAILNLNLSVSECCSLDKLPNAYGLFMVSKGIFSMTLSPLIGFVRDYTGSYSMCIHAMTVLIFLTFITWSMEFSCKAIHLRRDSSSRDTKKVQLDSDYKTVSIEK